MRMLVSVGSQYFHESEKRTSMPDVGSMAHFVVDEKYMEAFSIMLADWVYAHGGKIATIDLERTVTYNRQVTKRKSRN